MKFPTIKDAYYREKMRELTEFDPKARGFLEDASEIFVADDQRAIFFLGENREWYIKYVIKMNKNGKKEPLSDYLSYVVTRGLSYQYDMQDLPGVQKIKGIGPIEGINGLMGPLEFVEGKSLFYERGSFSGWELLDLFQDFEENTLREMRKRRVLHRDIKPANMILRKGKLVLIDWSLARSFREDRNSIAGGRICGTPYYFHEDFKRSVDLYALGMTLATVAGNDVRLLRMPKKEELDSGLLDVIAESVREKVGNAVADYFLRLTTAPCEYDPNTGKPVEIEMPKEDDGFTWVPSWALIGKSLESRL